MGQNQATRRQVGHDAEAGGARARNPEDEQPLDDFDPALNYLSAEGSSDALRIRASSISQHGGAPRQPHTVPTMFKWVHGGKECFVSGSYDHWDSKLPMVKSDHDFYTIIELSEGTHEYKFNVDGNWKHDPNQLTINNQVGTVNNVVTVHKTDFEVFDALAVDSLCAPSATNKPDSAGSPPGSYDTFIPNKQRTSDRIVTPPVLPQHLLQVILNKDIPVDIEPTLLPQPNHVMLNHLYALSIKDGVMVLSATHRYRKKYVTTLLYKPI